MAEGFELGDEAAGFAAGVQAAGEVVRAEVAVGLAGDQTGQMITSRARATTMIALFFAREKLTDIGAGLGARWRAVFAR